MTDCPAPAKPGRETILLLALIAAVGSLATQLLVPVLPLLAADLHVGAGDAQLVIATYLVGLGTGQLLAGPIADRAGRRPVLMGGTIVFCFGSALAWAAPGFWLLLAARLLQALGASAGIVTVRVLVGDLFPPDEAAGRQASLMAVVLISPALGPALGGALGEWLGWRAIFAILGAAGMIALAIIAVRLPEPPPRTSTRPATRIRDDLGGLARNPRFAGPALAIAAGSSALYMFLGTAPFLLAHDHGLSPRETGLTLMVVALASIAGTFLVARLDRRRIALETGAALTVVASLGLGAVALSGSAALGALMAPLVVLGLGAGICGPAGITRIIRSSPGREGTATSVAGACQMLASAGCASLLGRFAPMTPGKLALALILVTTVAGLGATLSAKSPDTAM